MTTLSLSTSSTGTLSKRMSLRITIIEQWEKKKSNIFLQRLRISQRRRKSRASLSLETTIRSASRSETTVHMHLAPLDQADSRRHLFSKGTTRWRRSRETQLCVKRRRRNRATYRFLCATSRLRLIESRAQSTTSTSTTIL